MSFYNLNFTKHTNERKLSVIEGIQKSPQIQLDGGEEGAAAKGLNVCSVLLLPLFITYHSWNTHPCTQPASQRSSHSAAANGKRIELIFGELISHPNLT